SVLDAAPPTPAGARRLTAPAAAVQAPAAASVGVVVTAGGGDTSWSEAGRRLGRPALSPPPAPRWPPPDPPCPSAVRLAARRTLAGTVVAARRETGKHRGGVPLCPGA